MRQLASKIVIVLSACITALALILLIGVSNKGSLGIRSQDESAAVLSQNTGQVLDNKELPAASISEPNSLTVTKPSSLDGVLRIEAIPPLTASRVDLQELRFQQAQAQNFVQNTQVKSTNSASKTIDLEPVDSGDDDLSLQQRFALAVESTDGMDWQGQNEQSNDVITLFSQLDPSVLSQLRPMTFNSHVYSTDQESRFVRLNDQRFVEGDYVQAGVELLAIRYDDIVLRVFGVKCRLPALKDWG
ncbi:hypothetical protein DBZ36_08480 [Alginatibacterium sediminis]|uniref:Type II secretion system protein GspB C-terminal domain-containing protein n=1 Tax=Alginatibacterium sediminis TaxID=2164068 RepID=A0A420ECQ5_9ALTE|nr:general secretion pathway protein GspB [Alginatibacterium sediminis]RKF18441.1 hypothetical protein DBZ36_08480 [Alginatibacterium sediminis]